MPVRSGVSAVLALACLTACSCGDDTAISSGGGGDGGGPTTTTGGASAGGAGGSGAEGGGGNGVGGGFGCASGIVCADGACCDTGEECFLDACLAVCESQVRCGPAGETCCDAGDVCLEGSCVVPGAACVDWTDCAEDEFCEPTIDQCLPQPGDDVLCQVVPTFDPVTPELEWSWTSTAIQPAFVQVINMPVVVDLEQDGVPDVVIVTSNNYSTAGAAYLRALDGATGAEKWSAAADVYLDANRVQPRVTPAAADLDGDGMVEIVTGKMGGGLIAFEHDGTFKWASTNANGTPFTTVLESATVAIADLEGDGSAEIVVGGAVFESDGSLRFNNGVLAGSQGSYGAVSIVADLDGDGALDIVSGRRAWDATGTLLWDNGLADGYPAIADLDLDGTPELVSISGGTVRVHDVSTGAALATLTMPGAGAGGPPTIANFDADPEPEIASANGTSYSVFDYAPAPTPALSVKWSSPTQDGSSNRTGSSVFDFQGDGAAEVVYGDECYFRVYEGETGAVVYELEMSTATIHEYPVVADVDGDNNTEVVVVANDLNHLNGTLTCPYPTANAKHGVFLFGDPNDNWVRTRRIWNQHAYHIVNIDSDGTLPQPEPASWVSPPGFNNYRQSNQGAGVFNAPDLQVSLGVSLDPCPAAIELRAVVSNAGSLGVAAGVRVDFYSGAPGTGTLLASLATTTALLPGQLEVVTLQIPDEPANMGTFYVIVDGVMMGDPDEVSECLEDNNEATVSGAVCPVAM
ncbi:MAG: VCBS repeat-containing protein [Polyangiaceae bacterium]|nr:VCBS repeat-containing protein [Polyangiaceae bacterium]